MISPLLLWARAHQDQKQQNEPRGEDCIITPFVQCFYALGGCSRINADNTLQSTKEGQDDDNKWIIYARHRRRLYLHHARELSQFSDAHDYYRLMMWCHDQRLFIHPAVCMRRHPSLYRDHIFAVSQDVERLTPLLAIPEALAIGFKDISNADDFDNDLRNEKREKEFNELNSGEGTDADVCRFFFDSLNMIVSDLVAAKSSPLTDPRWVFAELLGKVRTLKNAPYFEDDVVLDSETTGLADVLLQMIRNYINGGPLVGKLDRAELRWAVSVCLSHSTPLVIASTRSIGMIPMVHLFPHGGKETNSFLVARTSRPNSTERIAAFFSKHHGYDFMRDREGKWIFLVPSRPLQSGEEIRLQAMAPVCGKDSEAEKMWRLSCAAAPQEYMTSSAVAHMQRCLTRELIDRGGDILAERRGGAPS
ncbi:Present in the outer mitochondrial membrane proteome 28 [Trypanosoma cruzi]|uniref:Present in the outer mitochondrial membrane proteome 28 n=2 Tax=Trypanosoma cruzi TaxID=5693 RepID=A0A2V2X3U9_TRYCR|nr:Present in the outer mitochondrial membrane proteome 28 [Trypanosoma cruzi]